MLLFEAVASSLFNVQRVAHVVHAANHMGKTTKRLWHRIKHFAGEARKIDDMSGVRLIGIDEAIVKMGLHYVTVIHDLAQKRLALAR